MNEPLDDGSYWDNYWDNFGEAGWEIRRLNDINTKLAERLLEVEIENARLRNLNLKN